MSNSVQQRYFEDDVLNATPQRLRLMLIEGAIRFAKRSVALWTTEHEAAISSLGRCRNIIIELIASIRGDRDSCEYIVDHFVRDARLDDAQRTTDIDNLEQIARNALSVYLIIFRQLDEAQLEGDSAKVSAAIEILEIERETAAIVCEKLPEPPALKAPRNAGDVTSGDAAAILQKTEASTNPAAVGPATYGTNVGQSNSTMSFDA